MKKSIGTLVTAGTMVLLAACGSGGGYNHSAAGGNAPAVQSNQVIGTVAASATSAGDRLSGTVQSVDGGKVTLREGGSFNLSGQTAVTKLAPARLADLQAGRTVHVTADRQPDNTLLASVVVVDEPGRTTRLGQSPMSSGALMTNATINTIAGNTMTVVFPGGGAHVTLAPDAKIMTFANGTAADISQGATVFATISGGVAQSVYIQ